MRGAVIRETELPSFVLKRGKHKPIELAQAEKSYENSAAKVAAAASSSSSSSAALTLFLVFPIQSDCNCNYQCVCAFSLFPFSLSLIPICCLKLPKVSFFLSFSQLQLVSAVTCDDAEW